MPLFKKPSAWIPIILSLTMLMVLGAYLSKIIPPDPSGDEGTGAHLFQIWLILESVLIPFFVIRWFTKFRSQTLQILAIQIILVFIVCLPVFYFHL